MKRIIESNGEMDACSYCIILLIVTRIHIYCSDVNILVRTCVEYNVQENDIDGDSNKPSSNQI